jgi:hypothetical protein
MARRTSRRVALTAGVSAAALLAGAIVVRATGNAAGSASPSTMVTASVESSTPSPDGAPDESTPPPTPSSTVALAALGDVEIPIDPSGARAQRSEEGVRQVAVDYLVTVRQRLVYLTEDVGTEVLTGWAAPGVSLDTISRDVTEAAALRGRLSADGGQVWWVVAPLAIRIEAYSPDRARVAVWQTSIIASSADPVVSTEATQPMVRFQTDVVELVWTEDGWSVWSTTSTDGPTPMLAPSLPIASPDVFVASLDGFGLIRRHHG